MRGSRAIGYGLLSFASLSRVLAPRVAAAVRRAAKKCIPNSLDLMRLAMSPSPGCSESLEGPISRYGEALSVELLTMLQDGVRPGQCGEYGAFLEFVMGRGFSRASCHSQLLQDAWVVYETSEKRNGYFVEFGAFDGVTLSNTALLERAYDWTGLLAEPNPRFHDSIRAGRKAAFDSRAVWSSSGDHRMLVDCSELSTLSDFVGGDSHGAMRSRADQTWAVRTVSLNDLLTENGAPKVIDYLSIDTEGSELEILRAFDFSKYEIRHITVEHNHTAADYALEDLLTKQGYQRRLRGLSRWDSWYKLRE